MYTDIPVLKKCCCCLPLRDGILICGYLRLIAGMMTLGVGFIFTMAFLAFAHPETITFVIVMATFALISIDVIFNFILIVGCHRKSVSLLRLYCMCGLVYAVITITLFIIWFVHSLVPMWRYHDVEYHNERTWKNIGLMTAFVTFVLFLHIYLMILVRSELIKLRPYCQFRFINHTADPECFLQQQGYDVT